MELIGVRGILAGIVREREVDDTEEDGKAWFVAPKARHSKA